MTSYGVASIFNERRVKVQWIGTLAAFAPGQVVPVTLMPELRRGLTQSQSVALDAGYRALGAAVAAGARTVVDNLPLGAVRRVYY